MGSDFFKVPIILGCLPSAPSRLHAVWIGVEDFSERRHFTALARQPELVSTSAGAQAPRPGALNSLKACYKMARQNPSRTSPAPTSRNLKTKSHPHQLAARSRAPAIVRAACYTPTLISSCRANTEYIYTHTKCRPKPRRLARNAPRPSSSHCSLLCRVPLRSFALKSLQFNCAAGCQSPCMCDMPKLLPASLDVLSKRRTTCSGACWDPGDCSCIHFYSTCTVNSLE
jgi:hypothetical protein